MYNDFGSTNITSVVESRSPLSPDPNALTATAMFDGRTGRIASRTDANNQVTSYTYDDFGRIKTITGPYEQGKTQTDFRIPRR